MLTTHLLLLTNLRMCGGIPPLPIRLRSGVLNEARNMPSWHGT